MKAGDDMPSSIAQKIIALRETHEMSQASLASAIGVSRGLVAAWEHERSTPNEEQVKQLASVFRISESSLRPPRPYAPENYSLDELASVMIEKGDAICQELAGLLRRGAFNPIVGEVERISRRDRSPLETYHWQHPLDKRAHDDFMNKLIRPEVLPRLGGLVVFSEELIHREDDGKEAGMKPQVLSVDEETEIRDYVVLDPIDRTSEASRGIAGFANITVGSFAHGPLISIVYVLFDHFVSCYYALTGKGAWVRFRDGSTQPISPSEVGHLENAALSAYVGRPSRLSGLTRYQHLLDKQGQESTFVNLSGSYGFCLVASGQIDAFIELAKGYAYHDICSGAHILREAGGIVKSPDSFFDLTDPLLEVGIDRVPREGNTIDKLKEIWKSDESDTDGFCVRRQRFIATGTHDLAAQIAIEIARDGSQE